MPSGQDRFDVEVEQHAITEPILPEMITGDRQESRQHCTVERMILVPQRGGYSD